MKKSELKALLKPLIKECIRESILEEGILSSMISEVNRGLRAAPVLEQRKRPAPAELVTPSGAVEGFDADNASVKPTKSVNQRLVEHKKKLMSAIGSDAYGGIDLFEGTTPAPGQASQSQMANPMSGTDPSDAGVDISGLMAAGGNRWKGMF